MIATKSYKIPPFGVLLKSIRFRDFRANLLKKQQQQQLDDDMQFVKKTPKKLSPIQPIIPLVRFKLPADDADDKAKFITFDIKVRAGAPAGSPTYKKSMRVFEEGTPQEWMDVISGVNEIWRQNSVNGNVDRSATIAACLRGDSLTAFETGLEDARVDPDPNNNAPLAMTMDHINLAIQSVTQIVFPHRALEIQKLWMMRVMRKPFDLTTRKTAAALSRVNNYLPLFPLGVPASKFSETELVGLIEWSLPQEWRRKFDLKGYVPSMFDRERLMVECEAIERNEVQHKETTNDKGNNNKNGKKVKFANSKNNKKKSDAQRQAGVEFFCKECGTNNTHATPNCYILKNRAKREQEANGKAHAKPIHGKRTFRKEVNAITRRAAKDGKINVLAAALKREQGKIAKREKKVAAKTKAAPVAEESEETSSDESMNNMESRIPRKKKSKKKDIFADLMETEESEDEPWSKEDKCIQDAVMLEGKCKYDRKRGLILSVEYQTKEDFIKNDMDDIERQMLKTIQDEEKAEREAALNQESTIDITSDEEK